MWLKHCMMCVFHVVGVIAVALTKVKKVEQLNESTMFDDTPSFIVFYSFSDPSNPQVCKLYNNDEKSALIEKCSHEQLKRTFHQCQFSLHLLLRKSWEGSVCHSSTLFALEKFERLLIWPGLSINKTELLSLSKVIWVLHNICIHCSMRCALVSSSAWSCDQSRGEYIVEGISLK